MFSVSLWSIPDKLFIYISAQHVLSSENFKNCDVDIYTGSWRKWSKSVENRCSTHRGGEENWNWNEGNVVLYLDFRNVVEWSRKITLPYIPDYYKKWTNVTTPDIPSVSLKSKNHSLLKRYLDVTKIVGILSIVLIMIIDSNDFT